MRSWKLFPTFCKFFLLRLNKYLCKRINCWNLYEIIKTQIYFLVIAFCNIHGIVFNVLKHSKGNYIKFCLQTQFLASLSHSHIKAFKERLKARRFTISFMAFNIEVENWISNNLIHSRAATEKVAHSSEYSASFQVLQAIKSKFS